MFTPPAEGFTDAQLLKAALADYLATDETLVGWLGAGVDSIVDEGTADSTSPTPMIVMNAQPDSLTEAGDQSFPIIVEVLDRNRGMFEIERILGRIRRLVNTEAAAEHMTFPENVDIAVLSVRAVGTVGKGYSPSLEAESKGMLVLINVDGLPAAI